MDEDGDDDDAVLDDPVWLLPRNRSLVLTSETRCSSSNA